MFMFQLVKKKRKMAPSFSMWTQIHQPHRSLDFKTRGWRDLVNPETANWFSSLYLQSLAAGRVISPSTDALIECNSVRTQKSTIYHLFSIFRSWHLGIWAVLFVKSKTAKKSRFDLEGRCFFNHIHWSAVRRLQGDAFEDRKLTN